MVYVNILFQFIEAEYIFQMLIFTLIQYYKNVPFQYDFKIRTEYIVQK